MAAQTPPPPPQQEGMDVDAERMPASEQTAAARPAGHGQEPVDMKANEPQLHFLLKRFVTLALKVDTESRDAV